MEKETRSDSPTGLVDSVVSADELCAKADVASRRSAAEASILFDVHKRSVFERADQLCWKEGREERQMRTDSQQTSTAYIPFRSSCSSPAAAEDERAISVFSPR